MTSKIDFVTITLDDDELLHLFNKNMNFKYKKKIESM